MTYEDAFQIVYRPKFTGLGYLIINKALNRMKQVINYHLFCGARSWLVPDDQDPSHTPSHIRPICATPLPKSRLLLTLSGRSTRKMHFFGLLQNRKTEKIEGQRGSGGRV